MIKNRFAQLYIRAIILTVMIVGALLSLGALQPAPNWYVYYTNLSNYFCLIVVFAELAYTIKKISNEKDTTDDVNPGLKFACLIAITVTFVVYNTMLSNPFKAEYWNNASSIILHFVTPLLFWFDWIFLASHKNLKWYYPLCVLIFPLVYVIYILIRGYYLTGSAASWQVVYPYYFLDVSEIGYAKVGLWVLALIVAFFAFAVLVYILDKINKRSAIHKFRKQNPEAYAQEKAAKRAAKKAEKQSKKAKNKEVEENVAETSEPATNVTNINIVVDKNGKVKSISNNETATEEAVETETPAQEPNKKEIKKAEKQALKEAKLAEKEAAKQAKADAKAAKLAEKEALKTQKAEEKAAKKAAKQAKAQEAPAEEEVNEKEIKKAEKQALKEAKLAEKEAAKQAKADAKAAKLAEKEALKAQKAEEKAARKAEKEAEKQARKEAKEAEANEQEVGETVSEEVVVNNPASINIETNGNEINININNEDEK